MEPADLWDQQLENSLLLNRYCLLYEEFSYAMNTGDIGRVETCLASWILVFKAAKKHKCAAHISWYLSDVHFLYPAGLKKAVRYHILVNPGGKEGKHWAVDWCVELDNLLTKVGALHSRAFHPDFIFCRLSMADNSQITQLNES